MSKTVLNLIAAVCFVIAAVAFLATGPLWLGILFAALAVLSFVQFAMARGRSTN
jgi:hypothetical protein